MFVLASARLSQSLVQRLASLKVCALSVLTFVGSMTEPDKKTVSEETRALQRLTAGTFLRPSH